MKVAQIRNLTNRLINQTSKFEGYLATIAKGVNADQMKIEAQSCFDSLNAVLVELIFADAKRMTEQDKQLKKQAIDKAIAFV